MPISHQNVKLSKGRHASPAQGACVVEVASMLAGDRFGDHPRSVCPMLAAYMRGVNDLVAEEDRQRLLPYAAALVDTAGSRAELRARISACARWTHQLGEAGRVRAALLRWGGSVDMIGHACARAALRRGGMSLALTLADYLIEIDAPRSAGAPAGADDRAGQLDAVAGREHRVGAETPIRAPRQ
jgi:hypothetical protein